MRTVSTQRVYLKEAGNAATFVVPRGHTVASLSVSMDEDTGSHWGACVLTPQVSPDGRYWYTPVDYCGVPVGYASSTYVDSAYRFNARMIRTEDARFLRAVVTTAGSSGSWVRVTCVTSDNPPPRQPSRVVRLMANVTTTSTSYSDVTGLWAYLMAGRRYIVDARMIFQSTAAGEGTMFSFNGPSATKYTHGWYVPISDVAAPTYRFGRAYDTNTPSSGVSVTNSDFYSLGNAYIQPSASGYLSVRIRAEAGGGTITAVSGSTLEVRPL